jgi:3-deoxy-D-manno-octulosonic-acid transferase
MVEGDHGMRAAQRPAPTGPPSPGTRVRPAATPLFLLYDLLVAAAVALVLVPWELARRLARRTGPEVLRQRLGNGVPETGPGVRVLVHAVSVGEMAAAGALVSELARRIPDVSILLTTGNGDGLAAAERLRARHPEIRSVSLIPWDRRRGMRRWLRRVRPAFATVVETEIWPNLFRACADLSIPLSIVNGRMPPREAGRYRLAHPFFRKVLRTLEWIEAQTEADRRRFIEIGAVPDRVTAGGNLKFDAAAAEPAAEMAREESLVVAGSTHAPEERILIDALRTLRGRNPSARLALAPRQVSRARRIARWARTAGFEVAFGSDRSDAWDVLVVDRLGDLAPLYARGSIAVIGGTFAARGGQNPLEAAGRACAIVAGPSRDNFAEIFAGLDADRAIASADVARVSIVLESLLADPDRRREMGRRAREFRLAGRGAAGRCAQRIASELPVAASRDDRVRPGARST